MSKQVRSIFLLVATVVSVFIGLSLPSATLSQESPQAGTNATARNAALVAATAAVLKETSDLRKLPILRQVQSSTQSRAEIERMLIKNLDEETTPAQLHATEVTMKKLGLAPADFQYRALMLRLLTEQVAGYYDPKTREFHLADWIDIDGQKPVMAHELTHALQDQHFDLQRFAHWPKGDSDAELAAHALIEGDATLSMSFYVLRDPLRALAFLKSMGASGAASDELDKAPRALRESLLFPYQHGLLWTRRMYGEGGWDLVTKAFTELPQSTEQILHPEKYLAHEVPVKVTLPDLTPLLNRRGRKAEVRGQKSEISGQWAVSSEQSAAGSASTNSGQWAVSSGRSAAGSASANSEQWAASSEQSAAGSAGILPASFLNTQAAAGSADFPSALSAQREPLWSAATRRRFSSEMNHAQPARAAWKRIDSDVNGEFGFYLILDQFLKSPAESRRAAAGWGGDRAAVYEGPKGEVLFVCQSTWDTENDAREFFDAYVKRTQLRYPGATRSNSTDSPTRNPKLETRNSEAFSFRTSEGTVVIELRGSRVLVLEGVSDWINSNSLAKSLWQ